MEDGLISYNRAILVVGLILALAQTMNGMCLKKGSRNCDSLRPGYGCCKGYTCGPISAPKCNRRCGIYDVHLPICYLAGEKCGLVRGTKKCCDGYKCMDHDQETSYSGTCQLAPITSCKNVGANCGIFDPCCGNLNCTGVVEGFCCNGIARPEDLNTPCIPNV